MAGDDDDGRETEALRYCRESSDGSWRMAIKNEKENAQTHRWENEKEINGRENPTKNLDFGRNKQIVAQNPLRSAITEAAI